MLVPPGRWRPPPGHRRAHRRPRAHRPARDAARDGDLERERRAAFRILHPDAPAVAVTIAFAIARPEAGAGGIRDRRAPVEGLEDALAIANGDPVSAIGHPYGHGVVRRSDQMDIVAGG